MEAHTSRPGAFPAPAHWALPLPPPRFRTGETEAEQFRQLRAQTKNALARILSLIDDPPRIRGIHDSRDLAKVLRRRVKAAIVLSDALFAITRHPGGFANRLEALVTATVQLHGEPLSEIDVVIDVQGECPQSRQATLLHAAHELVRYAVINGMHARLLGHIEVRVDSTPGGTSLTITDDGWDSDPDMATSSEELALARLLAARHGAEIAYRRLAPLNLAVLHLRAGEG